MHRQAVITLELLDGLAGRAADMAVGLEDEAELDEGALGGKHRPALLRRGSAAG